MTTWIIKNMTGDPLPLHGVSLDPGQQLQVVTGLTPEMVAAKDRGALDIRPGDPTFEERREMTAAVQEGVDKMGKIVGQAPPPKAPAPPQPKPAVAPEATPPKPAPPPPPTPPLQAPNIPPKPPASPASAGSEAKDQNPGLIGSKDQPK